MLFQRSALRLMVRLECTTQLTSTYTHLEMLSWKPLTNLHVIISCVNKPNDLGYHHHQSFKHQLVHRTSARSLYIFLSILYKLQLPLQATMVIPCFQLRFRSWSCGLCSPPPGGFWMAPFLFYYR